MLNRLTNYFIFFDKENNDEIEKLIYSHYNIFLKLVAIFPSLNKKYFKWSMVQFVFIHLVLLYHSVLLAVTAYFVYDNISLFNQSFHYLLLMFLCSSMLMLTFTKRNTFYRLYEIIHSGFFNYNEPPNEYVIKVKSRIKQENYYMGFLPVYIVILSTVVVIIGPTVDKYIGNNYDDVKFINRNLPVKAWYPFETADGSLVYYISLIGQITVAFLVSGIIGSMDLIYINGVQELILQLSILNNSIQNLEKRARDQFKRIYSDTKDEVKDIYYNDQRYHRCYFYCLRQNVIHHQIVKQYYDELNSYWQLILVSAFSTATIVIALSMNEMAQESKHFSSGLVSTMMALGEVFNTLLLCIFGEKVTTMSKELRDSIYDIKWYNSFSNPYIKNIIPMMQEFTKRPLFISDMFAKANLETFSSVMNGAYSYFNLLSASKKS